MGDSGLPILGHLIEMFREGPDFPLHLYRDPRSGISRAIAGAAAVIAIGPDATQAIFSNRNKEYSQKGWHPVIGPFFNRGLMMLDFDEHMHHRRIMQEAFTRSRLTGYVDHIDQVATAMVADYPTDDAAVPVPPGDEGAHPRHRLGGLHGPRARNRPRSGHQGEPGVHHHHPGRWRDHPYQCPAVQMVARAASPQASRGLLLRAGQGTPQGRGHRHAHGVVPHRGRRRQQLHRRGHRQPHDLLDDGRPRHLHVDHHHDGLQPGRQPGMAGALPRRVGPAGRRPAGHRGAGEAGVA